MESITEPLTRIYENLVQSVTGAAPRVLTGIVVLLLAWIAAKLIAKLIGVLLNRIRFDSLLGRVGIDQMLKRVGVVQSLSTFVPKVVYYLLLFLFAQAAADAMGLTAISNAISSFLGYLPNLIAAALVLVLGSLLGQYAGQMVTRAAGESGIDFAGTLGSLVSGLILFIAGIMAISQLKIDTDIVRIVSVCLLAGLALAFGLSFGLGSREFIRNIIAGFYARKLVNPGDEVEVQGQRGVIHAITPVQTLVQAEDKTVAIANATFMEQVIKR